MAKYRILVVEDDPFVSGSLRKFLAQKDFIVNNDVVDSYDSGLEWVQTFKPDLILMDIMLSSGDRDGVLLAKVLEKNFTIPIIFLTQISDDDIVKTLESLPYVYLNKQDKLNKTELLININSTLRNHYKDPIDRHLTWKLGFCVTSKRHSYEKLYLPFEDIYLIKTAREMNNGKNTKVNQVIIVTVTDEFLFTSSLVRIASKLPKEFIQINQSTIVNIERVQNGDGNTITIENLGRSISIGDKYKPSVKKAFRKSWLNPSDFRNFFLRSS